MHNQGLIVHNQTILIYQLLNQLKNTFYEDDLDGQKLFDEIYYLELNEIIHNTLNNFYEKKIIFVEKVTLLYVLKTIKKEQIEQLSKDLFQKLIIIL